MRWPTGGPNANQRVTGSNSGYVPSDSQDSRGLELVGMNCDPNGSGRVKKRQTRKVVTMFCALSLTVPLGGCLLNGETPEPGLAIARSYTQRPAQSARGPRRAAAARLVAQIPLARIDRDRRAGAPIQSRHCRRGRPHRAGRRAGPRHRRGAVAAGRPWRQRQPFALVAEHRQAAGYRAAARSAICCRRRCRQATRSTSGARTGRRCGLRKKPRSPAATTAR